MTVENLTEWEKSDERRKEMFGDKLSPLSDTTNLAPAVSGAKLGDHIRAMFWTTIPTYIITLIIFTVLGIQQTSGGYTAGDISNYITELNGEFHLGAVTLIPAILIIVLLLCKVNAISALGISSFAAGAVSFFVQHATLQSIIQTLPLIFLQRVFLLAAVLSMSSKEQLFFKITHSAQNYSITL